MTAAGRAWSSLWRRLVGDLPSGPFVRLVQTQGLSSAGDALVAVALAGSVFFSEDPNTARSRVALSLALTMAPFAIVAPFLGPLVDRMRSGRRYIMVAAASARAFICIALAGALEQVWLYPLAFLSLVFSKTQAVAKSASVPDLVHSEGDLVRANSVLAMTAVVTGFVAAAAGYAVSTVGGGSWVLRAGALIFAAGAALAVEISANSHTARHATAAETVVQLRDSGVLRAGLIMALFRMSVGFLTFLIAFDFRRAGAPTWWFGVAISASMIGASLGNVVGPRLRTSVHEERMLVGAGLAIAVAALLVGQLDTRWGSVGFAAVLGASASCAKLAFDALVQRDAPAAMQGRSFARFEAAFQLMWVFGGLLPVVLVIDTGLGELLLGVVIGITSIWYGLRHYKSSANSSADNLSAAEPTSI